MEQKLIKIQNNGEQNERRLQIDSSANRKTNWQFGARSSYNCVLLMSREPEKKQEETKKKRKK